MSCYRQGRPGSACLGERLLLLQLPSSRHCPRPAPPWVQQLVAAAAETNYMTRPWPIAALFLARASGLEPLGPSPKLSPSGSLGCQHVSYHWLLSKLESARLWESAAKWQPGADLQGSPLSPQTPEKFHGACCASSFVSACRGFPPRRWTGRCFRQRPAHPGGEECRPQRRRDQQCHLHPPLPNPQALDRGGERGSGGTSGS
mmetsp:Transcript_24860/g.45010  ORF Transcript_24860/g.45010 Transcript_24860/m.45010 type:complete len:202 (+) Transcript_24860:332-937(+)